MAIKFDENGKMILVDAQAEACATDPDDDTQCLSCQ